MKQAVFSASVLIVVVMVLRAVFRERVPRRVQYALWGLVLLRLCLPFPLFESRLSVLGSMPETGITQREVYVFPLSKYEMGNDQAGYVIVEKDGQMLDPNSFGYSVLSDDGRTVTRYADKMSVGQILTYLWRGGALLCGLWFLGVNLNFYTRLRRTRRPFEASGCPLKVYVSGAVQSPCLFGLFRPAVYLTPQAAASPEALRCVLAHELAHYRHGDHIWSFARAACAAAYWWNPLVWAAAFLSRSDSELACDEAVVGPMDQSARLAYGRTLLDMIPQRRLPGGVVRGATCMTSNARSMKERINMIARKPKTAVPALALLLAVAAVTVGCTFSGAAAGAGETTYTLTRLSAGEAEENPIVLSGAEAELAAQIIETSLQMSAAWEGQEPARLTECYRIEACGPDGSVDDYYAYTLAGNSVLPEGSSVLQMGKNGWYTCMDDALYQKLTALCGGPLEAGTGADIEALLDIIVGEPSAASGIDVYIEQHQDEYDRILECGEEALQYLYGQFLEGGHTDLRGAVMERALRELLGGEDIKTAAGNGQEFFDAFLQYNCRLLELNSAEFMKEYHPKGYLLLQMAGKIV